ncbi:MAG: 16S rRNA (uracil(1498)-N(3))-methyltransferase [Gammaproteobacteria bacterium]
MLPRIYTNTAIEINQILTMSREVTHHLVTVLRLKAGNVVYLFNGEPGEYEAELISTGKSAEIKVQHFIEKTTESSLLIELGQGLSRGDRMDLTLQKATELGVHTITPLMTEKCQIKLKEDRADRKRTHWENILISASEQSGRTAIPRLNSPLSIAEWIAQPFRGLSIVLDPESTNSLSAIKERASAIRVLIGPESGLSEKEIALAKSKGFVALKLGPRILRTETAGMAALTLLQYEFGDL